MREIGSGIHPETKFLSSYELMKSNKWYASKHNDGRGIGQRFPFQKGKTGKKKRSDGSQVSPRSSTANSMRFYS